MSQTLPPDPTLYYSRVVESYAHFFDRPEVRLRFLHSTLAQQSAVRERLDARLTKFAFVKRSPLYDQLLKIWLYHLIFRETRRLLPDVSRSGHGLLSLKSRAPLSARVFFKCYQFRTAFFALGMAALAVVVFGAYRGIAWSARYVNAQLAERYGAGVVPSTAAAEARDHVFTEVAASGLPDYNAEKVWLVEEKDNYERYSNGARIVNDYATRTRPRSYYVFRPGGERLTEAPETQPVGIVYHTSESHLDPFNADNSASIETRTRGLVEYVRKNSSYNYVIDRFGQIYRVVRDEDAANHAGNSVWSDARGVYVGLNDSFLGVCFETTMAADGGERLTEAQLVAGRLLTQVLRSRFRIDDANCVTHGLVSVNPSNMRIAFHHDWARDFPFGAMGLSDKYQVAPASVAEFGFTYDEEIKAKLGGQLWPGVARAEQAFRQKAADANLDPETLRQRSRERYRRQFDAQRDIRSE